MAQKDYEGLLVESRLGIESSPEEIGRLDKIIELKGQNIALLQEKLSLAASEAEEIRASIDAQIQQIEQERKDIYGKKEALVADMSQKILTFYQKIRKWAENTTVVPVRKQACYGCFMRVNDKTYASVIKQDDIITCPHCGRILYKEFEDVEA